MTPGARKLKGALMKNKPAILVVDDQLHNIKLLEGFLVKQEYDIIPAESGEEALEKLSINQVDLVLLDVKMPEMSGLEVLTKLRADKKSERIPVVMITAHNEHEARVKAFESGCDDFITKPFDQYELLARVKSLLRIKFLNDEVDEAADEKLREEKVFIENALNTLQDIFFVLNSKGIFLRWNKAMTDVSGYIASEIALMQPVDLFRNDDIERVSRALRETVKEGSSCIDAMLVTKDERKIPYEIKTALIRDHAGNLIAISGIGRDLTERNKLEAQLLQAQKMEAVGTMAGGIAHDFNNMLSVIMGYGNMVMDKLEAGSPEKGHINQVLIAADKAASLTKRLLIFSRKQLVEVKSVNLNVLIHDLHKMLVRIIKENIDFNLDLADLPLRVLADAGQIEQVLINLAANASDAMQEGGRLTISTSLEEMDDQYVALCGYGKPGRYALIKVADTGHGMDAETRNKIFEPFFTTREIGEGTGLGLAISYGIVKRHEGLINVYSEPGQGTIFKIYLPLSEEVASPTGEREEAVPVKGGNETILVVEDDTALRDLTRMVLESFGYTVISAEDGEDATTKFMENKERISLVLLDMILPKKSGKEVSAAIRKASPRINILFTSGYTMDVFKSKEWTESGFDFIVKPSRPTELLQKVREILDR
jgi:PAS domain S-box-containing protein